MSETMDERREQDWKREKKRARSTCTPDLHQCPGGRKMVVEGEEILDLELTWAAEATGIETTMTMAQWLDERCRTQGELAYWMEVYRGLVEQMER